VNDTPARDSAVMPLIGSLRALPSWTAAPLASVPNTVAMSRARPVARLKTSLPSPATFLTLVNVSSRFSTPATASRLVPVMPEIDFARLATSPAVTFAAPPVVWMTRSVSLDTFSASTAAS
jgi:hypothetical protein